jgi:hypothetical protein
MKLDGEAMAMWMRNREHNARVLRQTLRTLDLLPTVSEDGSIYVQYVELLN